MPSGFSDNDVTRLRIALGRTVRAIDRGTNQDDITRTELTVLATIARTEQISLAELAEFEGINPTMLSRVVGKLETRGLVRRVHDSVDRRMVHTKITRAGIKVWNKDRAARSKLFAALLDQLPESEASTLRAAISALESLAGLVRPFP
jgi:DNA-binding MarR family transcriptional regulator